MTETRLGTCNLMCPEKEMLLREKERLLHPFEVMQSTRKSSKPKADPSKAVKCFSRPAAGRRMPDLKELRPGPVLLNTIKYLFSEVAIKNDCDWIVVYDFIFDRLRAIRQDLVVQQLDSKTSISIYEKIIRFHIYSDQRLCDKNISQYDPKINMQHLIECIEQLTMFYDEYEQNYKFEPNLNVNKNSETADCIYNRVQMETVYILLRLGQKKGLSRGLSLSEEFKKSKNIELALKISFAWYAKNYTLTCRLLQLLSPLLKCAVLCNLRIIRRESLLIMSSAYSSKNLSFPVSKLKELLLYQSLKKIKQDCEIFNLVFENNQIYFHKNNFNNSSQMASAEMIFSKDELHSMLPTILFEN